MKTSELIGPQLDWLVAKCEGLFDRKSTNGLPIGKLESGWTWHITHKNAWRLNDYLRFSPSTDWSQARMNFS